MIQRINTIRIREMLREISLSNCATLFDELKEMATSDPRTCEMRCWEQSGAEYVKPWRDPVNAVMDLMRHVLFKATRVRYQEKR